VQRERRDWERLLLPFDDQRRGGADGDRRRDRRNDRRAGVFALLPVEFDHGSSCAPGASRPTSGTVTIEVPAAGTLSAASNGDPATVVLTDGIFMRT